SDIRQIRHCILHCQGRTSFYYRTRFARTPSYELRNSKMNRNLSTINRK
ncbi:unnamed protein product, partial [Rotaria sp. Silwood1]